MLKTSQRQTLIKTALGQLPLDLVIDNVQVVNVYTGRIEPGAIGVKGGHIVTTDAAGMATRRRLDGWGSFALPGFIDAHVHLDSTIDADTVQLYDGMGRPRQVDFEIVGDPLMLYETGSPEKVVEIWTREK